MFSSPKVPSRGTARFALRQIYCDEESGRPLTFVLERDHRYFYLVFNLTDPPTYRTIRYMAGSDEAACVEWKASERRFGPSECRTAPGPKC